ncbi:MAG: zinc ribbon domain-containing protein [Solirubrobacterales bacterium]
MPLALFGIEDSSLSLAVNLVILVLVVLWLALAYWTFADARRRVGDPVLVTTATVLGFVPFIGPMIYTILRPPELLEDVRERDIETQASELRMRHLTAQSCPRCEHPIERSWLRCPECQHRLKDPCISCSRPVDPRWSVCPYCEAQLRRSSSDPSSGESTTTRKRSPRSSARTGERDRVESAATPAPKRRSSSSSKAVTGASKEASSSTASKPRSEPATQSATPPAESGEASGTTRPRRRSTTNS